MADGPPADTGASVTAPAAAAPPSDSQDAPMEFHKPKPVHSWRELFSEIGVVVIGVCIALAAEQSVEWLHWHERVIEARKVIATELTENLTGAIRRVRMAECAERRLDELSTILDTAAKSGNL